MCFVCPPLVTDRWTGLCDSRVAYATEKKLSRVWLCVFVEHLNLLIKQSFRIFICFKITVISMNLSRTKEFPSNSNFKVLKVPIVKNINGRSLKIKTNSRYAIHSKYIISNETSMTQKMIWLVSQFMILQTTLDISLLSLGLVEETQK